MLKIHLNDFEWFSVQRREFSFPLKISNSSTTSSSLLEKFPNLLIFTWESEFRVVTSLCSVFSNTSVGTQMFFISKSLKEFPAGPSLRLWYSSLWSFHSIISWNFSLIWFSVIAILQVTDKDKSQLSSLWRKYNLENIWAKIHIIWYACISIRKCSNKLNRFVFHQVKEMN